MRSCHFDAYNGLETKPCHLHLRIGEEKFAAKADREGLAEAGITWVLQVSKYVDDSRFLGGDVQLAACMLAALQTNSVKLENKACTERMMGIKMTGDRVHFYTIKTSVSYLQDLDEGLPGQDISILKSPALHLSKADERKQLLLHLWSLRKMALNIQYVRDSLSHHTQVIL